MIDSNEPELVERPGCITAYATLTWIWAALYLLAMVYLAVSSLSDGDTAVFGVFFALCLSVFAAIPIIMGLGIWRMTKWGWWLVMIVHLLWLALVALSFLIGGLLVFDDPASGISYVCGSGIGLAILGFILYWFFTNRELFLRPAKMEQVLGPDGQFVEKPAGQTNEQIMVIAVIVGTVAIFCLIPIVTIAILTLLGPQIGNVFSRVTAGLGPTPLP